LIFTATNKRREKGGEILQGRRILGEERNLENMGTRNYILLEVANYLLSASIVLYMLCRGIEPDNLEIKV